LEPIPLRENGKRKASTEVFYRFPDYFGEALALFVRLSAVFLIKKTPDREA
jgi:hypothetical protein